MSATVQNDEQRYLNYYKYIDDDYKYPYDVSKFTWNCIERRLHITNVEYSVAKEVKEIYIQHNPIDYKEAIKIGDDILLWLINQNKKKNILYFCTSLKEINKKVVLFNSNKNYPSNIIALPLHSEISIKLNEVFKGDMSKNLKQIKVEKKNILNYFNDIECVKNDKINYDSVIIFATNIAEASITIYPLDIVIDSGFQNLVVYDEFINNSVSYLSEISENSRIQRKGRVGRRDKGIIYYTYKEFSKQNIKINFWLCNENIDSILLNLLIFIKNIKINYKKIFEKHIFFLKQKKKGEDIFDNYEKSINQNKNFKYKYEFFIMIMLFQFNGHKLINNILFNIDERYKYCIFNKNKKIYFNKNDNFKLIDIKIEHFIDIDGNFYLIHPIENSLTRNWNWQIIDINYDSYSKIYNYFYNFILSNDIVQKINHINSNKMTLNKLYNKIIKYDFEINIYYQIFLFIKQFCSIYKTKKYFLKIINYNVVKLFIHSYNYNNLKLVFMFMSIIIITTKVDLWLFVNNSNDISQNYDNFYVNCGNYNSDILCIIELITNIINIIGKNNLFNYSKNNKTKIYSLKDIKKKIKKNKIFTFNWIKDIYIQNIKTYAKKNNLNWMSIISIIQVFGEAYILYFCVKNALQLLFKKNDHLINNKNSLLKTLFFFKINLFYYDSKTKIVKNILNNDIYKLKCNTNTYRYLQSSTLFFSLWYDIIMNKKIAFFYDINRLSINDLSEYDNYFNYFYIDKNNIPILIKI